MKLLQSFPKTAFLLSSILFVSVSGGRKHKTAAAASASSPVTTQIVESDHVAASSASMPQTMTMAQSRSSAANERAASAGYSQPIYSNQYDPSMMSDPSLAETSYYDSMVPTHHHQQQHHAAAAAQHAAASGLYHHHVPAPAGVGVPHARHAGAGAGAAAASSVAPYGAAAAPYAGYQGHQGYYGAGGYGYEYPNHRYAAQGSHQDAYVAKRAHGYGGYGWHPDLEVQTLFFIGIPLIIIPLLFLWPYFLYSLHSRGGHGGYGGGYGGYRSAAGDAEVITTPEKALKAKTDELTKKILPKLSKKSDKTSKSSDKSSKSSDKSNQSKSKST